MVGVILIAGYKDTSFHSFLRFIQAKLAKRNNKYKKLSSLFRNKDYYPYLCHFFHILTNDLHWFIIGTVLNNSMLFSITWSILPFASLVLIFLDDNLFRIKTFHLQTPYLSKKQRKVKEMEELTML